MGLPSEGTCPDSSSASELFASEAIGRLQTELARRRESGNARVVLFASFENECVPRICEAAARLVAPGTWLDVVVVGSEQGAPDCLRRLRPSGADPIPWPAVSAPPALPGFIVEEVSRQSDREPRILNQGTAGGEPVAVSPGLRRIRINLDPPELVGPIRIRPGDRLRVRVMDFPLSGPNQRAWVVESIDEKR
jgi:hypothetical protein